MIMIEKYVYRFISVTLLLLFWAGKAYAQQSIKLSNGTLSLEWRKGQVGWMLAVCQVRQGNKFVSFGKESGLCSLLYSKEKPSEAPLSVVQDGDTLHFPEKKFKYVYPKFQKAIAAVPMNKAGIRETFYPAVAQKEGKSIRFRQETSYGDYTAIWRLCKDFPTDIIVDLSFTASKDGFYSLPSPTVCTITEDELQWGIIPGFFQGNEIQPAFQLSYAYAQGLPAYPVLCRESTLTTLASIISNKSGITLAVIPDPGQDRNPYSIDKETHNSIWNIALSHMNSDAHLSPTAYHPVLGENQSFLKAGECTQFSFRITLADSDWYSVYKHAIYDVYEFKKILNLKDTKLSLTNRLFMLYDYVLNEKTALWNFKEYQGDTIAAQSYMSGVVGADNDAMKNSDIGAVWMLAKITGDESLNKNKLPYIEKFKMHQQVKDGFFKGVAEGQYYLWKKKIFTEEWGTHIEPIGLTYYTLMDLGNILLFEPEKQELKTLLKNGADRLLAWQQTDGSWMMAYDKKTHAPIYTDLQDLRPTFYGMLIAYRLLKNREYLNAAEKGAQWLIKEGINKGHFTGVCGDVRFVNDFATIQCAQALLDLYEVTNKKEYLEKSIEAARMYTSSIYTHPIPTQDIKIRKGKFWEDWQFSQNGLCFEHGGAMGSAVDHGPILLLSHCSLFLKMYQLTNDSLFLDMARAGALGRDAFVNSTTGVASYYWKNFDQGAGNFPQHAWWQIGWIYDYLISEVELRSEGRVKFPRGFMTPKVGSHKALGFQAGQIDGEKIDLMLRSDLVFVDNSNVDYITASDVNQKKLYVFLLNNQSKSNNIKVYFPDTQTYKNITIEPWGLEIITHNKG
ncbi:MAG: glycerophosphoryl diester phosphodiesterase [Bacteroides sp.]|uniref:glycerophosphoryl diester phosphodiesterase n=1 Tax=Bacteroides sp. TaxID=29523 RepID=UPI00283B7E16|nr:glycerophosphoryl diester phosphodiesterase [Bacteroides sp.]MDR3820244.1 glycerophosphoryl diester phosphodiesterase [Bacteroides sp.]